MQDNFKTADQAVLENGHTPTNTAERVQAFKDTMKSVWGKITELRGNADEKVNAGKFADVIDAAIEKAKVNGQENPADTADIAALQKLSKYYRDV